MMRRLALGLLAATALAGTVSAAPLQTVFVIAMENHNWTQPDPAGPPQQIFGNSAAPSINSLTTQGNANAVYTSYASSMNQVFYNGVAVHPSEPNYIWENAGSSFGNTTDNDPSAGNGNIYNQTSVTGLMTKKGVTWNNYQEDVQYSASPTGAISAQGTGGVAPSGATVTPNPYYNTLQ